MKTVSVLLIEAFTLDLLLPLMICMGSQCPEPSHLLGREYMKLRPKLSIYNYRTTGCVAHVGLWEGCIMDHTQVAIYKTVSVIINDTSFSNIKVPMMICMVPQCPEPSYVQAGML